MSRTMEVSGRFGSWTSLKVIVPSEASEVTKSVLFSVRALPLKQWEYTLVSFIKKSQTKQTKKQNKIHHYYCYVSDKKA